MKTPITDVEGRRLLNNLQRKSKARELLKKRPSFLIPALTFASALGLAVFVTRDFAATTSVKILVHFGFVFGVVSQVDTLIMRRRLDAVIELLNQDAE